MGNEMNATTSKRKNSTRSYLKPFPLTAEAAAARSARNDETIRKFGLDAPDHSCPHCGAAGEPCTAAGWEHAHTFQCDCDNDYRAD